jgi:trigger factor
VKTSVETLEGNKVRLSVEVDEDEFEAAVDSAFKRIANEIKIPGFRPGRAPRKLLEARLGTGVAREEALREALPGYYADAVRAHEVDVIAAPEIDITDGEESGPVAFDAVVEVRPQITLAGYTDLEVEIPSPVPSEEEIDAQIERLRDQFGELETVDRPAREGDHVRIDIAGSVGGEAVEGLTADDYLYPVGSSGIVPEIDEQLTGAKVGDILEFDAAHPDPDEDGELHFRVLVKEVKEKVLPEVNDEWVNEASEFDTVVELRADYLDRMTRVRSAQAAMAAQARTAEALAGLVDLELPEALVTAEMQEQLQNLAMRLQAQGMDLDQYAAITGQEPESMVAELREGAIQAVKIDLGLRAIADAEGFEVTDEDLDEEYERLAERFSEPVEDLRHQFEHHAGTAGLRADLRKRAALEWLVEQVALVDGEGNPVDRAALEPPADDEQDPDGEAPSLVAAALDEDDADADADAVDADTEPTEQDAP